MLIKQLNTRFYRNLTGKLPQLCDGINILYGQNAAGKTNTLEALFMFASGKSFRTSREKEIILRGQLGASAELEFCSGGIDKRLGVTILADGQSAKKRLSVDGEPVTRASEFLGQFRAVLFTPDHLNLVKGGPEERRRLVDLALCQIKPRYVRSLNDYERVLSQRNNYLKKLKLTGGAPDLDFLEVLSMQLSEAGATIARQRSLFCRHLDEYSGQLYSKLTDGRERLCIKYAGFSKGVVFDDEKSSADALYALYKKNLQNDLSLGRTFLGPHRDELMIFISNESVTEESIEGQEQSLEYGNEDGARKMAQAAARSFGSQGQQRSAVLAIKLSEGEIIKQLTGEYPVFLLDDLFSELDEGRRERLSGLLYDKQTVITSCDTSGLPRGADVRLIQVTNGKYEM